VKILHYQRDMRLAGGGVVRFVMDVCAAVAARGHEVVIAAPDVSDLPEAWRTGAPGVPRTRTVPAPDLPLELWSPRALREVRGAISGFDALHIHGVWWPSSVQMGRLAERLGIPYAVTPHGMFDDWAMKHSPVRKKLFYTLFARRLVGRAAIVQVTAQGELNQSQKWFPSTPSTIIPPVIDLSLFKVLPGPQEARAAFPPPLPGAPVILFLSRVHPQKCSEVLIDAAALLKQRGVDCNLFIAGPGEPAYLDSLTWRARDKGVEDRTRLLGMVSGRLKASLYELATIFALPSPQESFGLVMTEAMSCGTPVVTTRGVDIWPELETAGVAVLSELSAPAFAEAIAALLGDPARRERLSHAAGRWLSEYLDPAAVGVQYESMYRNICTG